MKYIAILALIIFSITISINAKALKSQSKSVIKTCVAKCIADSIKVKKDNETCRKECVAKLQAAQSSHPKVLSETESTVINCSLLGRRLCKKGDNSEACKWKKSTEHCEAKEKRLFTETTCPNSKGGRTPCIASGCNWTGTTCEPK